nr:MAG: hypothetical protein [Lokiarchaeota virus Skoll Meg22_1214]
MRKRKKDFICYEEEVDPYNPQNFLDGYIERMKYGEMVITAVNGEECLQTIPTTPKLHYPFNHEGELNFRGIEKVESYEKIDGTNILQYTYEDGNGKRYQSFKTRLTMFPSPEFQLLLNKALNKHPNIEKMPFLNNCNISYELYGYLNPITVIYEEDIDLKVLFGINDEKLILPPHVLKLIDNLKAADLLHVYMNHENENYIKFYNDERMKFEEGLEKIDREQFKGKEGSVWYCLKDGKYIMYKLKPPTIEEIHWKWFDEKKGMTRIGKISIRNTLLNALEDLYVLDHDSCLEYLREEYSEKMIERYEDYIKDEIENINREKKHEREIIRIYEENDLDFINKRRETMNFFAKKYGSKKPSITKIFNILKKYHEIREK